MKLQFKDVAGKYIDGKLVYDLTIQDLDGEIAEGRELPFSYVFGQEPTSVLESYINDHIDELKAIVIDESFESELPGNIQNIENVEEVDEFTRFFNEAENKIKAINEARDTELFTGVDLFDDVFSCTHDNFYFISNIIDFYKTKISNGSIKREDIRQNIISASKTVHVLNFDQLLELRDAIFEKMNDIYLKANYFKSIKLNECENADEILDLKIDFEEPISTDHFIDETKNSKNS